MRKVILSITIILTVMFISGISFSEGIETPKEDTTIAIEKIYAQKPVVQMAILLDTSGSMTGLINQARAELWSIVNEFIFARKGGATPEVQVALFEYGKSTVPSKDGYVRLIVPFTTDLDKLSEELFALKTNGGSEYCGWVIKDAVEKLKWTERADDLKVIFIAGNEPFTQGRVDYKKSCKAAIEKGIIVNTIHCGRQAEGIEGKWKDGALLSDGKFLNIDQNQAIVHIAAPQDKRIAELNSKFNDTYIAYGAKGLQFSARQKAQDKNAAFLSAEANLQRIVAKSSANYVNAGWDLVDAVKQNKVKIEDIKKEQLPENMQKMNETERKVYVKAKAKERAEIQKKIHQLNEKRKKYVAEEMKKRHKDDDTLGSAVIEAIREQAKKKNFEFKQPQEKSKPSAEKGEGK